MPNPSTIQIMRNDLEDVTRHAVFAKTRFSMVASLTPGTGTVVLKDSLKELDFSTGDEITLSIDGIKLWGGLLMNKGEGHFFPAVDTTNLSTVTDLMWVLSCTDFNLYMQKRVLRDTDGYTRIVGIGFDDQGNPGKIQFENATFFPHLSAGKMGATLRAAIANFMDIPPGFDYTTYVEDTDVDWADVNGKPAPLPQQGTYWNKVLDVFTNQGGFEARVDANKALHFSALENLESPWGFSDRPNGVDRIGFREGTVREDAMQMVTDALVWGGHDWQIQDNPDIVFARYPDPPANDVVARGITLTKEREQLSIDRITQYGRWQRAEMHVGELGYFEQQDVELRAAAIVSGPDTGTNEISGLDVGLDRPVWQVTLSWFAHDVPNGQHLVPGMIVPMTFWTMGDGILPLTLYLPLRQLDISFPTLPPKLPGADPLTYVRFEGQFGISYSDTRYLWRFLRARNDSVQALVAAASNNSTSTVAGAIGGFFPLELPDGARKDFTLPFSYLSGSTEVYLNGLLQRPRYEYLESDPAGGIISFVAAPFADDTIWVVCKTGAG